MYRHTVLIVGLTPEHYQALAESLPDLEFTSYDSLPTDTAAREALYGSFDFAYDMDGGRDWEERCPDLYMFKEQVPDETQPVHDDPDYYDFGHVNPRAERTRQSLYYMGKIRTMVEEIKVRA